MNHPEDFDQNQSNEHQKYNQDTKRGNPNNCFDPSQEPQWYGVSYQNSNGEYIPPITLYGGMGGKKHKGKKIALIVVCVMLCLILAALSVGVWYLFTHPLSDLTDPNTPSVTDGNGTPETGGTLYDSVDDSGYHYGGVVIAKNDGAGLIGHQNGSAGDAAGTTISAAAKVKDAVVEILTTKTGGNQTITAGVGSGVIIHADGIIVTNHHVVDGLETVYVRLTNGNTYKAALRGSDEEGDIAVIKIDPQETLTVAALGSSSALALGEPVIAIGNPLGELGGTVTNGIISATQRAVQVENVTMMLIQTNAAINSGNSGGGLFNMAGELIGVVNAKISAEGVEGLGFAIPIDTAIISINHLLKLGYVPGTPALGVSVTGARVQVSSGFWPTIKFMPYVTETAGSLQKGDLIYSIGNTVFQADDSETVLQMLRTAIRAYEVGDQIVLKVYRDSTLIEVTVTLVEYVPNAASVDFE